jgi:hypothetical protein
MIFELIIIAELGGLLFIGSKLLKSIKGIKRSVVMSPHVNGKSFDSSRIDVMDVEMPTVNVATPSDSNITSESSTVDTSSTTDKLRKLRGKRG